MVQVPMIKGNIVSKQGLNKGKQVLRFFSYLVLDTKYREIEINLEGKNLVINANLKEKATEGNEVVTYHQESRSSFEASDKKRATIPETY